MDRRELLDRSRLEIAKRADAVLASCGYDFAKGALVNAKAIPNLTSVQIGGSCS